MANASSSSSSSTTTTAAAARISLRVPARTHSEPKPGNHSAVLLKLDDTLLDDLKTAYESKTRLQFSSGSIPKLHIGPRAIDLTLAPDAFRLELYSSADPKNTTDFTYRTVVSHRAEPNAASQKATEGTGGTDAALANLQRNLASYAQEKEAKSANITNAVLSVPRNRFDAARKEKQDRRRGLLSAPGRNSPYDSPLSGSAGGLGGSSQGPTKDDEIRQRAMRTPLLHLLAVHPISAADLRSKTHVPLADLDAILPKIGKQADGKWQLTDRACKDLDVWKFPYPSAADRQTAVENAVRAYDRMRLGKDDKLWQMLLPESDRGQNINLSRLHLGPTGQVNRGGTPQHHPSPLAHADNANDSKAPSLAGTPKLGASTPRPASSAADIKKRLLSKDPQKARAVEEAKGKKRKERETAVGEKEVVVSPRPAKRAAKGPTSRKAESKIKSAEFVHSSDDASDEEGEVHEARVAKLAAPVQRSAAKTAPKPKTQSSGSDSSDVPIKTIKDAAKPKPKPMTDPHPRKLDPSPALKPLPGKLTPRTQPNLSAPTSQPQAHRRSPSGSKPDSRPTVPSPLGAARPRVASDMSERSSAAVPKPRANADPPKGLGITNGVVRKRHDTVIGGNNGDTIHVSGGTEKKLKGPTRKAVNGTLQLKTNGTVAAVAASVPAKKPVSTNGIKRKAETETPRATDGPTSSPAAKHRKTESNSSQSQKSGTSSSEVPRNKTLSRPPTANDTGPAPKAHQPPISTATTNGHHTPTANSTPYISTSELLDFLGSTDEGNGVIRDLTYAQGVHLAELFQDRYYPAYARFYDDIAAKRKRGERLDSGVHQRLLRMHSRLEGMKKEIALASERQGVKSEIGIGPGREG